MYLGIHVELSNVLVCCLSFKTNFFYFLNFSFRSENSFKQTHCDEFRDSCLDVTILTFLDECALMMGAVVGGDDRVVFSTGSVVGN